MAALVTVVVVTVPGLRLAYRAPALHVSLETAEAMIALVVACLVLGRSRETARLQDVLLGGGFALLTAANLVLTAVPSAVALSGGSPLTRWAPLLVRLLGTLLVVVAAVVGPHRRVPRQRVRGLLVVVVGVVLLALAGALLLGDRLPPAAAPEPALTGRLALAEGHPLATAAQVLTGLFYAVAAVCFTRQAAGSADGLVRALGPACAVSAVARVAYLLFPSLYSEYVCVGDLLRLASYVLLFVGAAAEVRSTWERAAVQDDRRRMARDLHDGLTQELSYIYAHSRRLAASDDRVAGISGAAARALDEARSAIASLTLAPTEGFSDVLLATTDGLASRYDAKVELDVDDTVPVLPAQGDAVLRIVAEAFRNAVLHGGAATVRVVVGGLPLSLCVSDDGRGFDPAGDPGPGFGLTSMRERAEACGATFGVTSRPGAGAVVQVRWS